MKLKWIKRFSLCLAIIGMLLPCFSFIATHSAAANGPFGGGSGTESDPYLIATPEHLDAIRYYPEAHFRQIANIDLADWGNWMPLCPSIGAFSGSYDGSGYTISNLTILDPDAVNCGLFNYIGETGVISNLRLVNFNIDVWFTAGTLVANNLGTIINCHARGGSVNCDGPGAGGLAGRNGGTIRYCSADVQVSGNNYVGGLVGTADTSEPWIAYSYALGDVSAAEHAAGGLVGYLIAGTLHSCFAQGNVSAASWAGGLVGYTSKDITDCFATGNVTATEYGCGGLVGSLQANITNCFSTGRVDQTNDCGGLVGEAISSSVTASYYNTETSGQSDDAGKGIPKTTAEMYSGPSSDIYVGWSDTKWTFYSNQYPLLSSLEASLTMVIQPSDAVADGAQWSIDGGRTWIDSGTKRYVAPGRYLVSFTEIHGWNIPGKTNVYLDFLDDIEVSRSYTRKQFLVDVAVYPENTGTVTGAGTYYYGDTATLFAEPASGYDFLHWREGKIVISTDNKLEFTVQDNLNLIAVFSPQQYAISVTVTPSAGGSVTGAGTYTHGSSVTLTATPNQGYRFVNWTESGSEVSREAKYTFTATANRTLTANFEPAGADRIAGSNRYGTAIEISQQGWLQGADTVVLARGDEYADALAGVPLAYQLDAPILLTRTNLLTPATKAEILRLGASKVIILGGTGAVSDAVAQELIVMGLTVERISGSGRYDTAAAIARKMAQGGSFNTAYIAVGTDFADALSSSAYAAMSGCPILLVKTNSIPAPTTQAFTELWISKTVVIGGSGVISDTVFNQLPGSQRISGSNRYNTAIALAERFLPAETSRVFIATGTDFPDAIAGGVLAAKYNSGVLLVRGDLPAPNQAVQDFLQSKNIGFASIFGGSGAVSAKLEQWLKDNLK